jgi:hypothetical protein
MADRSYAVAAGTRQLVEAALRRRIGRKRGEKECAAGQREYCRVVIRRNSDLPLENKGGREERKPSAMPHENRVSTRHNDAGDVAQFIRPLAAATEGVTQPPFGVEYKYA